MKHLKRILAIVLMATLLMTTLMVTASPAFAATKKGGKGVKTTSVVLSQTGTVTLNVGDTLALSATVQPENSTQSVKWSTSKKTVATVNAHGVVTAKKAGTAKIAAKSGKKKATITVKVVDPYAPSKVTLDRSGTVTLPLGQTLMLNATLSPSTAQSGLTWSTSSKKVATVSNGVVTPKKKGTATITVKTRNGKKAKVKVKVVKASSTPVDQTPVTPVVTPVPAEPVPAPQPVQPTEQTTGHQHSWMAETTYTLVNHPAEGHYETVVTVPEQTTEQLVEHGAEGHWETVTQTVTLEEAWDETVTVEDVPAWQEEYLWMRCMACGAIVTADADSDQTFWDLHADKCPGHVTQPSWHDDTPHNRELAYEILDERINEDGTPLIFITHLQGPSRFEFDIRKKDHPAVTHEEVVHHDPVMGEQTDKVWVVDQQPWTEVVTETVPAKTTQVWVEDRAAWSETVMTETGRKVCATCGAVE